MELGNAFRVFSSRNYRYFFFGQLISRMGTWMQRTAVIWVVYTMTHSVLWVGITTFAEQFPSFILSPAGGITADKYDRHKIVIVTQTVSAIQAILLTFIYANGWHNIGILLSLSLLLGIANAYDIPARQSMVNELVDSPDDLPGAIAMNSSLNNFARLAGPALAGIAMATLGATFCFASNAISFVAVIYCLIKLRLPHRDLTVKGSNIYQQFKDGWLYVRKNEEISKILTLSALLCFLVTTYNTLQPYFAKDVFHGDAATYGYINTATGVGAFLSTFFIASQKKGKSLKKILLINMILLGVGLLMMSFVTKLPVYLFMCFVCGFGNMSAIPICNTIIQTASSDEMRGRSVGFFTMATMGTLPLGSIVVGFFAKHFSAQNCQLVQGIICIIIAFVFLPYLLRKPKNNL
ncbi:MFS transporter [Rhizosphaericola mali]|uniref:MFS transporter n=1 Tax=Rhizosphaericola mali TaxID=2545455 RepID=A0A5P2G277_9BACT|nr:MFS transporter [Rhizosphaericola mali]QES87932.1 MFS transporter [Rhizosphaericola mali]